MANSLAAIKKQIAALEKKANALIKSEASQAIAKVKEMIDRYGFTAEDLGFGAKRGKKAGGARPARKTRKAGKTIGVPMYRDPASGKTWTGRGKPPAWIAGAADRTAFLIDSAAGSSVNEDKPAKAARKPASRGRGGAAAKKAARKSSGNPAARKSPRRSADSSASAKAPAATKGAATKRAAAKKSGKAKRSSESARAAAAEAAAGADQTAG